jgi:hypothetical protein
MISRTFDGVTSLILQQAYKGRPLFIAVVVKKTEKSSLRPSTSSNEKIRLSMSSLRSVGTSKALSTSIQALVNKDGLFRLIISRFLRRLSPQNGTKVLRHEAVTWRQAAWRDLGTRPCQA